MYIRLRKNIRKFPYLKPSPQGRLKHSFHHFLAALIQFYPFEQQFNGRVKKIIDRAKICFKTLAIKGMTGLNQRWIFFSTTRILIQKSLYF